MRTKEQAKYFLPFVQAMAEGKQLQFKYKENSCWADVKTPDDWFTDMDYRVLDFRIKPTPTLRPWKPEEVPVGALLRDKRVTFGNPAIVTIIALRGVYVHFLDPKCARLTDLPCVLFDENWEHSLDHGKTWLPCGVME